MTKEASFILKIANYYEKTVFNYYTIAVTLYKLNQSNVKFKFLTIS